MGLGKEREKRSVGKADALAKRSDVKERAGTRSMLEEGGDDWRRLEEARWWLRDEEKPGEGKELYEGGLLRLG